MKLYQHHSIPELNGLNVQLLDTLEIKVTVDPVGLMEQLKLIMIDYVLKLMEHLTLSYLLLTQLHVADSSLVYHKDVTEVKSELHGVGSLEPE